MAEHGIRIGGIGFSGIQTALDFPTRNPDLTVGDTPVWFKQNGGLVNATVGRLGTAVDVGEGMSSSSSINIDGIQLDVEVDGHCLVVNGKAFDVRIDGGKVVATETSAPAPRDDGAAVRVVVGGGERIPPEVLSTATRRFDNQLSALDAVVLQNVATGLEAASPHTSPRASSPLAEAMAAAGQDKGRLELLYRATSKPIPAADVPAILAAFTKDDSRQEALGMLLGHVDGKVDRNATMAAFAQYDPRSPAGMLIPLL